MKKYLNTLFITSQGAYLSKEGETVVIKIDGELKNRIPIHTLGGIICFGQVSLSPFLMDLCAENNVALSMLSESGRFMARISGRMSGNVLLRREQYRKADDPAFSTALARNILVGKLANCRTVLQRGIRDHSSKINEAELAAAALKLSDYIQILPNAVCMDNLRGLEGDAAKVYFGVYDQLILAQKEEFVFSKRVRRPPTDRVNCLLSFLYTLLAHDVGSALESVGLDSAVGYLHRDRSGRPGLALDIMEEFRPFIVDRLVLSLINRNQVDPKGFIISESGSVIMDEETRKDVIVAYQKRKQEDLVHPFLGESVKVGLLFYIQALLLARCLRGDIDGYPVFIWR